MYETQNFVYAHVKTKQRQILKNDHLNLNIDL